jgi:hypothetical protein
MSIHAETIQSLHAKIRKAAQTPQNVGECGREDKSEKNIQHISPQGVLFAPQHLVPGIRWDSESQMQILYAHKMKHILRHYENVCCLQKFCMFTRKSLHRR